jgi:hypothetical protein
VIGKGKTHLPQISQMSADQGKPKTLTTKDTKEHKGREIPDIAMNMTPSLPILSCVL